MKEYELLIFDWDGTLVDSAAFIVQCVQKTAKDLDLKVPSGEKVSDGIGLELMENLSRMFPTADLEMVLSHYRQHYFEGYEDIQLFEGAKETLFDLKDKGYALAVATSKGRHGLNLALSDEDLKGFFSATRCGDEDYTKPHPGVLLGMLEELKLDPDCAVMIGDSEYDMQLARNADVDCVGVTYGVHSVERLVPYKPIACINDIRELKALFAGVHRAVS